MARGSAALRRATWLALVALVASGLILGTGFSTASGGQTATSSASAGALVPIMPSPLSFTGGISPNSVTNTGETFYKATVYNVFYDLGSSVGLAGSEDGTADTSVDDVLIMKIVRQFDGSTRTFHHDYSKGCTTPEPLPPTNLPATLFGATGYYTISVILKDRCGGEEGSSALWLR